MKTYIKNLLSILVLASFLFLGLVAGNGTALAFNEYNGWVCPEENNNSGQCEQNYNVTDCTWKAGGGCETTVPELQ